jgi:hypothetical protein
MSTVPELIAQWREQKLNGLGLLRGLVSHPKWTVPISNNAASEILADGSISAVQIHERPDGQRWLMIFSSSETLEVYAKANSLPAGQHILTTRGTWVFRLDYNGLNRIWVDPFNAHDIFYEEHQFGMLHEMADAILVEEALLGLRQGNPPANAFQRALEYRNYKVMVKMTDGKAGMVTAPDSKGRRLAAIFTAADAYEAFEREAAELDPRAELRTLRLDGAGLFQTLHGMNMDGFVFNCAGPATPVAFAQQAASIFLQPERK